MIPFHKENQLVNNNYKLVDKTTLSKYEHTPNTQQQQNLTTN